MTATAKERLVYGVLCLLIGTWAIAGGDTGFAGAYHRYSGLLSGCSLGWLIKTYFPTPEEGDPVSIQALPYVAVYAGLALIIVSLVWLRA